MRKLKVLGLALVAICALSALASASASAKYDSEVEHTILSGTQATANTFTTTIGNVTCATATFSGTALTSTKVEGGFTAAEQTVTPTYSGCTLSGLKVTINTTGCTYKFTTPESLKAKVHVEGCTIVIKDTAGLGCEVKVKPQTPTGHVGFTNQGAGKTRDVLVTATVTGIHYTYTAPCPNAGGVAGTEENGTYSGTVTLKGANTAGEQVGIWVTS